MCSCARCSMFSKFLNIKRQLKIDQDANPTISPRSSLDSGALSCSSDSSISPPTSPSNAPNSVENAVSDCLEAWLEYVTAITNLCESGNRLQQTFLDLDYWGRQTNEQQQSNSCQQPQPGSPSVDTNPPTASTELWADLIRKTLSAVNNVEAHASFLLRNFILTPDTISGGARVSGLQGKTQDHQRSRNYN